MEEVNSSGQMAVYMKVTGEIIWQKEREG